MKDLWTLLRHAWLSRLTTSFVGDPHQHVEHTASEIPKNLIPRWSRSRFRKSITWYILPNITILGVVPCIADTISVIATNTIQTIYNTQQILSSCFDTNHLPFRENLQTICKDIKLWTIELIFLTHLTFILFNKQWKLWLAEILWACRAQNFMSKFIKKCSY